MTNTNIDCSDARLFKFLFHFKYEYDINDGRYL